MGELIKPGGRLEVSVSFGRFENDALAWEKWSSFSPNKYLEEVGSLSTPGSVAQKKAYFEAHYKKVAAAAKKAEELELENMAGSQTPTPDGSCSENSSGYDNTTISLSNDERFVEENTGASTMSVVTNHTIVDEIEDNNARAACGHDRISFIDGLVESTNSKINAAIVSADEAKRKLKYNAVESKPDGRDDLTDSEIDSATANAEDAKDEMKYNAVKFEPDGKDDSTGSKIDSATANAEEVKDELKYNAVESKPDDGDDSTGSEIYSATANAEEANDAMKYIAVGSNPDFGDDFELAGVEIHQDDSSLIVEKASKQKNAVDHSRVVKKETSKLKNATQKVTPTKKDRDVRETSRKSIASPAVKLSKASTPRNSKPTSVSTPISTSRKNGNGSLASSGNRATPTSLHMSLSLGPTKSSAVVPVTRKSLIMEQMGDKDIVKRAFKSFQHLNTGLSTNDSLSSLKQVPSTVSKPKVSTSPIPRKGSEGVRKDVKKSSTQRIQPGIRPKASQSRSDKSSTLKNTVAAAVSPPNGLRSNERAEKRKEFVKNLGAKSVAREAENARLSAMSKEKESETKTLRDTLKFKAKPIPSLYRNQEKCKTPSG